MLEKTVPGRRWPSVAEHLSSIAYTLELLSSTRKQKLYSPQDSQVERTGHLQVCFRIALWPESSGA